MPTHIDTIELSAEDMARGMREQEYSVWLEQYRKGEMTDERWQDLAKDEDFTAWVADL